MTLAVGSMTVIAGPAMPAWHLAPSLAVAGLAFAIVSSMLADIVLGQLPAGQAASQSGVVNTVIQLGGVTAIAVIGVLFFGALGQHPAIGDQDRPVVSRGPLRGSGPGQPAGARQAGAPLITGRRATRIALARWMQGAEQRIDAQAPASTTSTSSCPSVMIEKFLSFWHNEVCASLRLCHYGTVTGRN
jgi:hypothetical protein